jgi:hypothetical protein
VQFSNLATRRLRDPANRCRRALRARPAHIRCAGLDLARRRVCAPSLLLRPCAPVCRRAAPRRRPPGSERNRCAWAGRRRRHVRRHGADRREDRLDRDAVRVHRDARSSRVDPRHARDARDRGRRRRDGRPERRGRPDGAVCLLRPSGDRGGPGLRRPPGVPAGATRGRGVGDAAGGRRRACRDARASRYPCPSAGAGGRRAPGSCGRDSGGAGSRRVAAGRGERRVGRAGGERRGAGRLGGVGSQRRRRSDSPPGAAQRRGGRWRDAHRCGSGDWGAGPQQPSKRRADDGASCAARRDARDSRRAERPAVRLDGRSCAHATGGVPLPMAPPEAGRRQTYHG